MESEKKLDELQPEKKSLHGERMGYKQKDKVKSVVIGGDDGKNLWLSGAKNIHAQMCKANAKQRNMATPMSYVVHILILNFISILAQQFLAISLASANHSEGVP